MRSPRVQPVPDGKYSGRGFWGAYGVGKLTILVRDGHCEATYISGAGYTTASYHTLSCLLTANQVQVHETRCTMIYNGVASDLPKRVKTERSPCYPRVQGIHGHIRFTSADADTPYELEIDPSTLAARTAAKRSVERITLKLER